MKTDNERNKAIKAAESVMSKWSFENGIPWRPETLLEAIDAYLSVARAKQDGWLPIESAPFGETGKPETYFLGARQDGNRINTATCYRNQHGAYEWWGGGLNPTHWMPLQPLPQPPKQGE